MCRPSGWRRWVLLLCSGLLPVVCACGIEQPQAEQTAYPISGLYTPGNRLGASDPTDTPMGLGDRCKSFPKLAEGEAGTEGMLTVQYATRTVDGRYAPKNCTAAWIETPDGRYVATIEIRAALHRDGLVYWQEHACTEKLGPDVVSTATLADHERMHMVGWKGLDLDGMPVPDGPYTLYIEVTESDKEVGEVATFEVTKGPEAFDIDAPVDFEGLLEAVQLTWEPEGNGG